MSYLQTAGLFDPIDMDTITGYACVKEADAKTAPMFAKRQEVRNNWNPTGTYTPDDLERLVNAAFEMMRDAGVGILDKALADSQMPSARAALIAARDYIHQVEADQFEYRDAVRAARAQGVEQITAPGLKRWILRAMEAAQGAVFTAAKVACDRPWWLNFLVGTMKVFIAAADFIMSIPGIVYNALKAAVEVVDKFAQIVKYSMYAGAAAGGWWLWKKYGKKK